jgi:hypothetical protein
MTTTRTQNLLAAALVCALAAGFSSDQVMQKRMEIGG